MRNRTRLILSLLLVAGIAAPAAADETGWSGIWVTDEGAMKLTQNGVDVRGEYGRGAQLEAEAEGKKLAGTYRVGNVTGRLEFEMQPGGRHFTGKWIRGGGRSGTWRGWKQDPEAESAESAAFGGYWLTSLGTFMLTQKEGAVTGRWRHADWDRIEGEVKGRRFTGSLIRPRWQGRVWLEVTADGKRLYGLTDESTPTAIRGVRIETFEKDPELEAGEIAQGMAENGLLYFARPPEGWRKGKAVDAIVLMHGSNWTTKGMVWVTGRNWPELGKNYMIVGIQGDQWAAWSNPDDLRHNYHYVNWMGRSTYKGYPFTERDSPYLVSQVVEELAKKHNWKRIFIGGHSQGGFMAYLMYMHYPEQFAGVFPVAGGMVIQADPSVFEDEELRQAQRDTPLAIVHGQHDNAVSYDTGLYIRDRYEAEGFPLMTFIDPNLGHPYDFLPIGDAVAWLDVMSTKDEKKLVAFGRNAAKEERWSDVGSALNRARALGCEKKLAAAEKALDAAAAKGAQRFQSLFEKGEAGDWVPEFIEWRRQFAGAASSAPVMSAYEALRKEHDAKATALIGEARQAFRDGNRKLGKQKYQELVDTWYAAAKWPIVKRWLAGMD